MFGYACDETPELMPRRSTAHRLVERQASCAGRPPAVAASGRQVAGHDALRRRQAASIDTVVLSTQHARTSNAGAARSRDRGNHQAGAAGRPDQGDIKFLVNPTGRFVIGGPQGDCGLTGRKIIVDTYGGAAPHGGGAFSGKDPSKVDRSAAYAGRYVAKNIVAAGLARAPDPGVVRDRRGRADLGDGHTFGTGRVSDAKITKLVREHFDLRPKGIIQMLDLLRPIYEKTAAYGHFGREEPEFSWEATDKALALAEAAGVEPTARVA
jgi:S-adenosylmethionine synthetase